VYSGNRQLTHHFRAVDIESAATALPAVNWRQPGSTS